MIKKIALVLAVLFSLGLVGLVTTTSNVASAAATPVQQSLGWHDGCTTGSNGQCTITNRAGVNPDSIVITPRRTVVPVNISSTDTTITFRFIQTGSSAVFVGAVNFDVHVDYTTPTIPPTTQPTTTAPTTQPTTSPPPTTDPVLADYPTPTSVGVPAGTTLTTVNGDMVITTPNTVVDSKNITGNVDIRTSGVEIKNSVIAGTVLNDSTNTHNAFTIHDSTVGPATGCSDYQNGGIGIENYTAKRNVIRGFSDGFRVAGGNITIQDNYVKLCAINLSVHSDGIQAYGAANGKNILIDHNAIDQTSVPDQAQTSPIFIPNDGANQGNQNIEVTVTNNVLAGGGYTLRVFGDLPFTAPSVSGNKIVNNSWGYGPLDLNCDSIGTFTGNAVVTYDFATGKILSTVRSLDSAC